MAEASSQPESSDSQKQRRAALSQLPIDLKNLEPGDSPQFDAETIIETIELLISIWEMYNRSVPEASQPPVDPHVHALLERFFREQPNSTVRTWYREETNGCGHHGIYGGGDWANKSEWWKDYQILRLLICAAHEKLSKMRLRTEKAQELEIRVGKFLYNQTELILNPGLKGLMENA